MKKLTIVISVVMLLLLVVGCAKKAEPAQTASTKVEAATASKGTYVPGTYKGQAQGFGGMITVTVRVDQSSILEATVEGPKETPAVGGKAISDKLASQAKTGSVDVVSGATFTSKGVQEALAIALDAAVKGVADAPKGELTFVPGTYQGVSEGYNNEVKLDVTFSEHKIEDIQVAYSRETAHVGDVAYDIVFADAKAANGSGVDVVSGATFTSKAIKNALTMAAEKAKCSDIQTFKTNTVTHEAKAPIEATYDVVIVGAGGAGMGAAAEAAMDGATVVVLEKNAEIGGNTLVSGGQFQAVMDYLVWDPANPDATSATWSYDGKTYKKVMAANGQLETLKTILNWSEKPFDAKYYKTHEYVAGDIVELSKHGVHQEYLATLKALKKEIKQYVNWADAKIKKGAKETDLPLFSTVNLHIFQTYYGGLRPTADGSSWVYGNLDLVTQFCKDGVFLKTWLEDQGAKFNDAAQITLIGALWYRENINLGCDINKDGVLDAGGNWGTYFVPTRNTLLKTSPTANQNKIMTRTDVKNLIVDNTGKVVGVEAVQYDGTQVTVYAKKGVILTTGGYAANIGLVSETNTYWDSKFITDATQTTNRSSQQGDGMKMGQAVGGALTGTGFTQMMPISWIDNGDLAFGNGLYATYINPTTGKRFVDESAERDVLSLGEFNNGVVVNSIPGVFMEITNAKTALTYPYPYDVYEGVKPVKISTDDVENRVYYFSSPAELKSKVLDKFGMTADPNEIYNTIAAYDKALKATGHPDDGIAKGQYSYSVGEFDGTNTYEGSNYKLDGVLLRVRLMAPSTHHTMGGLVVDLNRHVIGTNGKPIEGLYAAGEVTGGIHGGNRLGGNAIVEIFVSGIKAADTICGK